MNKICTILLSITFAFAIYAPSANAGDTLPICSISGGETYPDGCLCTDTIGRWNSKARECQCTDPNSEFLGRHRDQGDVCGCVEGYEKLDVAPGELSICVPEGFGDPDVYLNAVKDVRPAGYVYIPAAKPAPKLPSFQRREATPDLSGFGGLQQVDLEPIQYCETLYQEFVDAIRSQNIEVIGAGDAALACISDEDGHINTLFYECTYAGEAEDRQCGENEFWGGQNFDACYNGQDPIENCENPGQLGYTRRDNMVCFDNSQLGNLAEVQAECN